MFNVNLNVLRSTDETSATDTVEVTEGTEQQETTQSAPEMVGIPTIEDLLLKDHKERVLGKDKISRSQMASYLEFFKTDPETGEVAEDMGDVMAHPLLTDVLGEYDTEMWAKIAKQGKSALGEKAKDVDEKYIAMWNEWKDNSGHGSSVPKSHMWLKGVVAAALLIAESYEEAQATIAAATEKAEAEKAAKAEAEATKKAEEEAAKAAEQTEATDAEKEELAKEGSDVANIMEAVENAVTKKEETPEAEQGEE
jgi:hypothetical protein